jgi:uncharacterized protein (TIGR03437 family)
MLELIRPVGGHGLSQTWPGIRGLSRLLCPFIILSLSGIVSAQTPPAIRIVYVTQSADFQPGLAQPGSLSSIFTTGLQGEPGIIAATKYPLSNELSGVSVLIDSLPAPILAIGFFDGYQQINVQVPWEAAFANVPQQTVIVAQNGIQAQTSYTGDSPQLSVFFSDANGYGIVQHASDYSLVTPQNPAHPGETLTAYAENLGPVDNQPATGEPSPFDPLAGSYTPETAGCLVRTPKLTFNPTSSPQSYSAPYSYSVMTPGLVGVYQLNFALPSSMPSGDIPMTLSRYASETSAVFFPLGGCFGFGFTSRSVLLPIR